MRKLAALFALLALIPGHAFAGGKLSSGELKYLISTCFDSFHHPGGVPFQVDRRKFAALGFTVSKDDTGKFEAQRILSQSVYSFQKVSKGPQIEIKRNARKPGVLLYKGCTFSGDDYNMSMPQITDIPSKQVQDMLESEARRRGFAPHRNSKGKTVWIKGDVAVFLVVTFETPRGQAIDGRQPPVNIFIDGVHPKDLRGITR